MAEKFIMSSVNCPISDFETSSCREFRTLSSGSGPIAIGPIERSQNRNIQKSAEKRLTLTWENDGKVHFLIGKLSNLGFRNVKLWGITNSIVWSWSRNNRSNRTIAKPKHPKTAVAD